MGIREKDKKRNESLFRKNATSGGKVREGKKSSYTEYILGDICSTHIIKVLQIALWGRDFPSHPQFIEEKNGIHKRKLILLK